MIENVLSVRELQKDDIEYIVQYWLNAEDDFLLEMGVDLAKLPTEAELSTMLLQQLKQSHTKKQSYCIIWKIDSKPVGHSNINKINFGEKAYMHLHLWRSNRRKKGVGSQFVKMSLPYFFQNYKLKKLYCEPFALNPAPNKALKKIGFTF
jgi:RimJ/RimL family protein N-acetyltransferase